MLFISTAPGKLSFVVRLDRRPETKSGMSLRAAFPTFCTDTLYYSFLRNYVHRNMYSVVELPDAPTSYEMPPRIRVSSDALYI